MARVGLYNTRNIQILLAGFSVMLAIVVLLSSFFLASRRDFLDRDVGHRLDAQLAKSEEMLVRVQIQAENAINKLDARVDAAQRATTEMAEALSKKIDALPKDAQPNALLAILDDKVGALSNKIRQVEESSGQIPAALSGYSNQVKSLSERYRKLEDAIAQDPLKSVSIVILGKELDSLKKSLDEKLIAQNASIDRLYTILFGSFVAIALSIVTQAVSSFFAARRQPEPAK